MNVDRGWHVREHADGVPLALCAYCRLGEGARVAVRSYWHLAPWQVSDFTPPRDPAFVGLFPANAPPGRGAVATVRYLDCMIYLATPACDAIAVDRPTIILAPGMSNLWRLP